MESPCRFIRKGALVAWAAFALFGSPAGAAEEQKHSTRVDDAPGSGTVELRRAESLLGLDVTSSDDRKVGDIVDLAFRFDESPRITHVLIMTGGFLDLGGDVRAVPVEAVTFDRNATRLDHDQARFEGAPLITVERAAFFASAATVKQTDDYFGPANPKRSEPAASRGDLATTAAKQEFNTSPGYVVYSDLARNPLNSREDSLELGTVTDVWVDLGTNHAPLIEIQPSPGVSLPVEFRSTLRCEVPSARFAGQREGEEAFLVHLGAGDLTDASPVAAKDQVSLVVATSALDTVLHLDIPPEHLRKTEAR